jgi:hypothetical protein
MWSETRHRSRADVGVDVGSMDHPKEGRMKAVVVGELGME